MRPHGEKGDGVAPAGVGAARTSLPGEGDTKPPRLGPGGGTPPTPGVGRLPACGAAALIGPIEGPRCAHTVRRMIWSTINGVRAARTSLLGGEGQRSPGSARGAARRVPGGGGARERQGGARGGPAAVRCTSSAQPKSARHAYDSDARYLSRVPVAWAFVEAIFWWQLNSGVIAHRRVPGGFGA
jgi:hypothetical protein